MSRVLTYDEMAVINTLVDAWNAFLILPDQHDDDTTEFRSGIHRLQEKVMCRPTREAMK